MGLGGGLFLFLNRFQNGFYVQCSTLSASRFAAFGGEGLVNKPAKITDSGQAHYTYKDKLKHMQI